MRNPYPVYVVDDDPNIYVWIEAVCKGRNLPCRSFAGGDEFLDAATGLGLGCVLLDMRMSPRTGLEVQSALIERGIAMPVIAMTGYGDVDVAVQSMRLGAVDFLEKPFAEEVLLEALTRGSRILGDGDGLKS